LEEPQSSSKLRELKNLNKALDKNSQKIININFSLALYQLPELVISGISVLFLFLYYQIYCGGKGSLDWGIYFIANNLQAILLKVKKGFSLLSTISA